MKIGQEVICINAHNVRELTKGNHYIIADIQKLCKCKHVSIDVGIPLPPHLRGKKVYCKNCGVACQANNTWFNITRFAPIETIPESHDKEIEKLMEEAIYNFI